ncbi:MAG: glycoside hydrolase family 3 N-terminal domain-containing protein [Anaerolineales bacterium]|nr:glycoside hydrolase family 3 N-terminal domain-containing protein [Anaerolineales bacterium]
MRPPRLLIGSLLVVFLISLLEGTFGNVGAASYSPEVERARAILEEMTPEERVGQLFLVTFKGTETGPETPIYDLIRNHYIGGVVLLTQNDNFLDAPETLSGVVDLISRLQQVEWEASFQAATGVEGTALSQYVPLFVGIAQPAAGSPDAQILSGLTPLPSQMAIGATWDTTLAEKVGRVAGEELSRLGFNLLFGPSLDVLEVPEIAARNGLGTDVFGGDPFWVSQMGRAYVRGLHLGSQNRLLVVARSFPGRGATDRPPGQEAPTVRKSLEQLKQIELAPFFAVTGNAPDILSMADGLLVSHIRYQGFQGNIRATTRPISFDSQALSQLLALPALANWRAAGGLLVSDDLGSATVRRFYDPAGTGFQARLAARDAFLAGNDLIYLGNLKSSDSDEYATVLSVLSFFVQKYREDSAFAQRVDASAVRILSAKLRLVGEFRPEAVLPDPQALEGIGKSENVVFEVARRAATLVSPLGGELETVLPEAPGLGDDMVFITDVRNLTQCSLCMPRSLIGLHDMQQAVIRLYGPRAGELVSPSRLSSYSFEDLKALLENQEAGVALEISLRRADWIVINLLDSGPSQEQTAVLRRFLAERPDLFRNKNLVLFEFDAPYYLDATDISNLTAYYCLYGKSGPFLDVAVRLLFREMTPQGALPVSVPGVGYNLFTALTPDPGQVIQLSIDFPASPTGVSGTPTPEAPPTPTFRIGDTMTVRTGVILDHNGHPVPDGTTVQFFLSPSGTGGILQQVEAATVGGVATASFNIVQAGLLEIRAISEPAMTSVILQLDVSSDSFAVTTVAPTQEPGTNPTPLPSPVPTSVPAAVEEFAPRASTWLMMVLLLSGMGAGIYTVGRQVVSVTWSIRWVLCTVLGGVIGYTYLALRLPGSSLLFEQTQSIGVGGVVVATALLGWAAGYVWFRRRA